MTPALAATVRRLEALLRSAGWQPSPLLANALLIEAAYIAALTGVPKAEIERVFKDVSESAYAAASDKPLLFGPGGQIVA